MPTIPDRIAWAVDLLDVQPDDRILEVGCGTGAAVSLIAPRLTRGHITAIDRSEKAVARAGTVNAEHISCGGVRILRATLLDLPSEGEGYDKVFAVNVNAFWLHPERELPAARRRLVPGGTLLLVLESPSAGRAREFIETMPGNLEYYGFGTVATLVRADVMVAVHATNGSL